MSEMTNQVSEPRPQTSDIRNPASDLRSPSTDRSSPSGSAPRLPAPVRITEQVWPEGTVPVVTIRCITYQHVDFIRDAIEGFLMQETTFPVEIIIHDDASTDGTAEIVKGYAEKYPQLLRTIFQKENQFSQGREVWARVRSRIDEMQCGEFIAFCEGDDYWISKEKLQKQAEILEAENDISLVFHNAWAKHTGESRKDWFFGTNIPAGQTEFSLSDLIASHHWIVPTCSMMLRRTNPHLHDLRQFAFGGDLIIQLSAGLCGKLKYWDEVAGVYRRHMGGVFTAALSSADHVNDKIVPNFVWVLWCLIKHLQSESEIKVVKERIRRTIIETSEFKFNELGFNGGFQTRMVLAYLEDVLEKARPEFTESYHAEFNRDLAAMIRESCMKGFGNFTRKKSRILAMDGKLCQAFQWTWQAHKEGASTLMQAMSVFFVSFAYSLNWIRHRAFKFSKNP